MALRGIFITGAQQWKTATIIDIAKSKTCCFSSQTVRSNIDERNDQARQNLKIIAVLLRGLPNGYQDNSAPYA